MVAFCGKEFNVRKSMRFIGMFGTSAAFAFIVAFGGVAHSAVQTVSSVGCSEAVNQKFRCSLPMSSVHPLSSVIMVYFDFYAVAGTTYGPTLVKFSPSGSSYTDFGTEFSQTNSGSVDVETNAVNILQNISEYDQVYGEVLSNSPVSINGIGMGVVTSI
jgi:hypothetical protein